jgi:two-component system cell cycle sensor histidine kinase/response regulator CckA
VSVEEETLSVAVPDVSRPREKKFWRSFMFLAIAILAFVLLTDYLPLGDEVYLWLSHSKLASEVTLSLMFALAVSFVMLAFAAHRLRSASRTEGGITARLREATEKFTTLVEQLPAIVYISNIVPGQPAHYISPQFEAITGFSPESFLEHSDLGLSLIHPEDSERVVGAWRSAIQDGGTFYAEYRMSKKDGSYMWVRDEAVVVRAPDGAPLNIQGVTFDISDQKATEEALIERDANSRALFDFSPFPVWVYDELTHRFLAVNQTALAQYGYSRDEYFTMTVSDICSPEERARFLAYIDVGPAQLTRDAGAWRHLKKDGTLIDVEVTSHSFTYEARKARLIVGIDVTEKNAALLERHKMEETLRQAQKMEAIGRLAGGIAHDFNNLLSIIQNYVRFVANDIEDSGHVEDLNQALKASDRAADLVRQLLTFSRHDEAKLEVLDVGKLLRDIEQMLARTVGEGIHLEVATADAGSVKIGRGQLEQVILNLVVNARDAMPNGGRLTIRTSDADLDERFSSRYGNCAPGRFVRLEVEDSGSGMSDEILANVLEPFFTTKRSEGGSGLGLATVYGIVSRSGGAITAESQLEAGTVFSVYLPVTPDLLPTEAGERAGALVEAEIS